MCMFLFLYIYICVCIICHDRRPFIRRSRLLMAQGECCTVPPAVPVESRRSAHACAWTKWAHPASAATIHPHIRAGTRSARPLPQLRRHLYGQPLSRGVERKGTHGVPMEYSARGTRGYSRSTPEHGRGTRGYSQSTQGVLSQGRSGVLTRYP